MQCIAYSSVALLPHFIKGINGYGLHKINLLQATKRTTVYQYTLQFMIVKIIKYHFKPNFLHFSKDGFTSPIFGKLQSRNNEL